MDAAIQDASRVLHELSHHAGVVVTPRPSATLFQRIEFLRLRENRVLAVLVTQTGQVQNKALTVDFPMTSDELTRAANYLSELLAHVPIEEARSRISSEMQREQALYESLSSKALRLGYAATSQPAEERVLIEGTNSFLDAPEFADVDRMKVVLRALEEKTRLLSLLDRVQEANEMRIYIGRESEFASADVSVVASPYGPEGQVLGTVGVIGPTRMNYQRVVALVNFTAQVLSRVMTQELGGK
jgi:heat-inducible transcriptional repressor